MQRTVNVATVRYYFFKYNLKIKIEQKGYKEMLKNYHEDSVRAQSKTELAPISTDYKFEDSSSSRRMFFLGNVLDCVCDWSSIED